jgi:hypothetical protein
MLSKSVQSNNNLAINLYLVVADQIAVRKMKYAATGEEDRCGRRRGWRRYCRRNRSRDNVNYLLRLYISPFQRVGKYRLKWLQYQIVFLFVVRHTRSFFLLWKTEGINFHSFPRLDEIKWENEKNGNVSIKFWNFRIQYRWVLLTTFCCHFFQNEEYKNN